jgi:hypothetical protein
MNERLRATAERLSAIRWEGNLEHTRSRVALMQEYLRRAAWWAQATPAVWPFGDLATAVDPMVLVPEPLRLAVLDAVRRQAPASWIAEDLVTWILRWAALEPRPVAPRPDVDDPFEPLVLFLERGGEFTVENRMIQVESAAVPIRPIEAYLTRAPLDLDSAALDARDAG